MMKKDDSEMPKYASLNKVMSKRGQELQCPRNLTFSVMQKVHEVEEKRQCRTALYEKIALSVLCVFSLSILVYVLKDLFIRIPIDLFGCFSSGAVVPAFFIVAFFIVLKHILQKRFGNI